MKLLFFIGSMRGGGAERVMATLCNELVKRNYEVTLATIEDDFSFYKLDNRIKRISLYKKDNLTFVQKIIWRLKWYSYIRRTVKKEKPDIVISFIYRLTSSVLISTRFLNIPIIASEHITFDRKMSIIEKIKRYYINRLADMVTVLTEHDFHKIGNRLKNKIVMANPLPYDLSENFTSIRREKLIIGVGNIDRYIQKGFDNLISIWGEIAYKYPEWKLQIAGGGSEEKVSYLKMLSQSHNVSDRVDFLGVVEDIQSKFRECSIFVLSSRFEGFGMVLIEAMSQGCACVSFDCIAGPGEILTDGEDGLLIPNQNMEEMRNALCNLIENEDRREVLSERASTSVQRFSVENTVDRWENLFQSILLEKH